MNEANILMPSVGCLGIILLFGLVLHAATRRGVTKAKAGSSRSLRAEIGELTPAELAEDARADEAWADKHTREGVAANGGTEWKDSKGRWHRL